MSIWGMESGSSPRVQDVDRLTELYQAYLKLVWRSLRAAGVRAADLDDVTHDVFLVVRRKLLTSNPVPFIPGRSTEDYERAWSAWLCRVAFYQAKNYRTRPSHHRQEFMDNVDEILNRRDETAQREQRDYLLRAGRARTTPLHRLTWPGFGGRAACASRAVERESARQDKVRQFIAHRSIGGME